MCRNAELPREAACVSVNSTYTQEEADALAAVTSEYKSISAFMEACPLAETLERAAAGPGPITPSARCDPCSHPTHLHC